MQQRRIEREAAREMEKELKAQKKRRLVGRVERNGEVTLNETDEEEMPEVLFNEEELEEFNKDACWLCREEENDDGMGWIQCSCCSLWYHKGCTGNQKDQIMGMIKQDIACFEFNCDSCHKK